MRLIHHPSHLAGRCQPVTRPPPLCRPGSRTQSRRRCTCRRREGQHSGRSSHSWRPPASCRAAPARSDTVFSPQKMDPRARVWGDGETALGLVNSARQDALRTTVAKPRLPASRSNTHLRVIRAFPSRTCECAVKAWALACLVAGGHFVSLAVAFRPWWQLILVVGTTRFTLMLPASKSSYDFGHLTVLPQEVGLRPAARSTHTARRAAPCPPRRPALENG